MTSQPLQDRDAQAGVTLVEVLVVLVLIGTVAGAVALSVGSLGRGPDASREMQLLVARLNRAADEAVLTGQAVAFAWDATGYSFSVAEGGAWAPHPVAILGQVHAMPRGLSLRGSDDATGRYVVTGDLLPPSGAALSLRLGDVAAVFDGAAARISTEPAT